MPESEDRTEREPAGWKPAVVPVEAARTAMEVRLPWPLAEPHPAARKAPTSNIADARRRSLLVRLGIYSRPRAHAGCALPSVMASTIPLLRCDADSVTNVVPQLGLDVAVLE